MGPVCFGLFCYDFEKEQVTKFAFCASKILIIQCQIRTNRYQNIILGILQGHCALNRVLRGHFLGNQDVAVKYKSEVIYVKFW